MSNAKPGYTKSSCLILTDSLDLKPGITTEMYWLELSGAGATVAALAVLENRTESILKQTC
jgi:hypothetical protein